MSERKGLSLRQKQFVAEYVVDLNATQAAIRAGYNPDSARVLGSRLLNNPAIQEAVSEHAQTVIARAKVSATNLLRELQLVAFSDIDDYEISERGRLRTRKRIDTGRRRAVKSFKCRTRIVRVVRDGETTTTTSETEVEVVLHDKLRALQMLATYQGLLQRHKEPDPLRELFLALPVEVREGLRAAILDNAPAFGLPKPFALETPAPTFDKSGDVVVRVDGPELQGESSSPVSQK